MRAVAFSVFFFVVFSLYGLESLKFYLDEAEEIKESPKWPVPPEYLDLGYFSPPERTTDPVGGLTYYLENSRFFSIRNSSFRQLGSALNRYYQIEGLYFVESTIEHYDKPIMWGGEVVKTTREYYIVNRDKAFRYLDGNWIEDEELYYIIETIKRVEKVVQSGSGK